MAEIVKTVTVPLLLPVTLGETTYDSLTFRRMKAKDTLASEETEDKALAGYRLFAALADVPVEVILELDMEDISEVGAKVVPLMGKRAAGMLAKELAKLSPGET